MAYLGGRLLASMGAWFEPCLLRESNSQQRFANFRQIDLKSRFSKYRFSKYRFPKFRFSKFRFQNIDFINIDFKKFRFRNFDFKQFDFGKSIKQTNGSANKHTLQIGTLQRTDLQQSVGCPCWVCPCFSSLPTRKLLQSSSFTDERLWYTP